GAHPDAAAWAELGETLIEDEQRVEALSALDRAAELGAADGATVEVAQQAVVEIGQTLAVLWRESSLPDPDAALKLARIVFHAGRHKQPHVRGVYEELAHALRDLGASEQAATVQREVLDAWPLHPAAPQAALVLIEIELERGDRDAADQARADLIARFGDGSAWAKANGAEAARVVVDDTRIALARSRFVASRAASEHQAGKDDARHAAARVALEDVVARSQAPAQVLEARYLLAHVLAYQEAYVEAAAQLRDVVDALADDDHTRPLALGKLVAAYEEAIGQAIKAGTLTLPKPGDPATAEPLDLPPLVGELRAAYDQVLPTLDRAEDVASVLMSKASIDLSFGRVEDAEASLRQLLADECFTARARAARDQLVPLVKARQGDAAAQAIVDDLEARGCLDSARSVAARDKQLEKQLARAAALGARGDHAGAARLLSREYYQVPAGSALLDDVVAATAIAYEKAGALADAARMWSELDRRDELAASPMWVEMLQHRAQVLDRQLDWPQAATAYLRVASEAAAHRKKGRAAEVDRQIEAATVRAAQLRALDHVWLDRGDELGAITLWLRVARAGGASDQARAAWIEAGDLARRAGKRDVLAAIHAEWRKGHSDRDVAIVLEAFEAKAADAAADHKGAELRFKEAVRLGRDAAGSLGPRAADALAECQFWLADDDARHDTTIRTFRWGKSRDEDQKQLDLLGRRMQALGAAFYEASYASQAWGVAAAVRAADVTLATIEALVSQPPPEWVITELKFDQGAADYAEQMRKILQSEYGNAAYQLNAVLQGPRYPGTERWLHEAQERLALIAPYVPVKGAVRTEAPVEDVR
ncbi:MAG: hypothetical protein KC464_35580, partial [Myxococcales bacterium]|nr:hypothetical protein [Myxococcales bacterium]